MRKGARKLKNAGQPLIERLRAEVIELEEHMVAVRATAAPFKNLQNHRARDHIAPGEILGGWRVAFHEALAGLVDQIAAFAAAALGDEHASAGDAGRVELPHLHVLHRKARAQRHADAVAGVGERVGGRCVDAAGAAGRKHGRARLDVIDLASFEFDGNHAGDDAVNIDHEVGRHPFAQKHRFGGKIGLKERVQKRVPGAVSGGAGTRRLPALAKILRLSAKRALINAPILGARERHAHVFEFEHRLRPFAAHVFDGVLVAYVVRALDGVVHVPAPIVLGIVARDGAGDAALRRDRVRARREDLRQHGGLESRARQFKRGAHAGTATANDNSVVFECSHLEHKHDVDPPKRLTAEHGDNHRVIRQARDRREAAEVVRTHVVGANCPETHPCVGKIGDERGKSEHKHEWVGQQVSEVFTVRVGIHQKIAGKSEQVACEHER